MTLNAAPIPLPRTAAPPLRHPPRGLWQVAGDGALVGALVATIVALALLWAWLDGYLW